MDNIGYCNLRDVRYNNAARCDAYDAWYWRVFDKLASIENVNAQRSKMYDFINFSISCIEIDLLGWVVRSGIPRRMAPMPISRYEFLNIIESACHHKDELREAFYALLPQPIAEELTQYYFENTGDILVQKLITNGLIN